MYRTSPLRGPCRSASRAPARWRAILSWNTLLFLVGALVLGTASASPVGAGGAGGAGGASAGGAAGGSTGERKTAAKRDPIPSPVRSAEKTQEYRIKSAFLFNFTKYVTWPESAFENARSPLVVAVVGDDPFGPVLDKDCGGKTANGRKIVVKRFANVDRLEACHLLFVPASEAASGAVIAQRYAGTSVLIVGESKGFAERFGLINFYIEKQKVNFEVNTESVVRAKLDISSQLLKLARIVKAKQ